MNITTQKNLCYYIAPNGKAPFVEWMHSIRDKMTSVRIMRRLDRVTLGYYGDYKILGDGIFELRLAFGAGYRIYCAEENNSVVILLCGGDKATQKFDINLAKQYWQEFRGQCDE